jgi:hypothetical protein
MEHSPSGLVVYVPVETNVGIAMLRFETQSSSLLSNVVTENPVAPSDFRARLKLAQQPWAATAREELGRSFRPAEYAERDKGKTVFLKDISHQGSLPSSFEIEDASLLSSPVREAFAKRQVLNDLKIDAKDLIALLGFPENSTDYSSIFGGKPAGGLEVWKDSSDNFRKLAIDTGMRLISSKEIGEAGSKERVLSQLQESRGIIFIAAHAAGARIPLPGGDIELTPNDIASLKFKNSPFVVLRICSGAESGFAEAFIKAGAIGVWANRGLIRPAETNAQIKAFLTEINSGKSVNDAIWTVSKRNMSARAGVGLFTELKLSPTSPSMPYEE